MSSKRSHRSNVSDINNKIRTPTGNNHKVQFNESSASNRSYKFNQNAQITNTTLKPNFNDINRKYDLILDKEKVRVGQ